MHFCGALTEQKRRNTAAHYNRMDSLTPICHLHFLCISMPELAKPSGAIPNGESSDYLMTFCTLAKLRIQGELLRQTAGSAATAVRAAAGESKSP